MSVSRPEKWRLFVALAVALPGVACSPVDGEHAQGETRALGRAAIMKQRLRTDRTDVRRHYTFETPRHDRIDAVVTEVGEQGDYFWMNGRAANSEASEVMLKGDDDDVYGWVVYRDRGVAFEYTTNDEGVVEVEQVPVTKIFPVCSVPPDATFEPPTAELAGADGDDVALAPPAGTFPKHVGTYPEGTDVLKLQSRPGEAKVWFINFADTMNGSEPKSGHTKADVWQSWAITAAILYPFHINVTTDPAVHAAAGRANSGCVTMIYADIGAGSSCGVNIIGTGRCCNNHLYRGGYATGRIIGHESGHGLGMGHDGGDNGGEYFNGFSEFQWTALMGNVWPGDRWAEGLFQWSKGEYTSATEKQDDLSIISRALPYVDDDIPTSRPLSIEGTMVRREANWGQIARNTDTDSWTFGVAAGGGRAMLKVNRIEDRGGGMLDVDASIVDSTEKVMAQSNAMVARSSMLNVDLPAGNYTLIVKGGGEGTPARGFSSYSSVGLYAIEGTITGGMGTPTGTGGMGGAAGTGGTTGAGGAGGGGAIGGAGGASGAAGRGGTTGTAGMTGAAGTMGTAGAAGAAGRGGTTGTAGTTGAAGTSGVAGTTGTAGAAGNTGAAGALGVPDAGSGMPPGAGPGQVDGGCSCDVSSSGPGPSASLLAAMVFGTVWFRRRGRRPLFAATSPSAGRGAGSPWRPFHYRPTGAPRSHRRPTAPRRPPWTRRSCTRRRRPET